MQFTKMEGLGNDFVVVDGSVDVTPDLVRRLADRRRGVGADGVLQVTVDDGVVRMEYWNADGSAAEMCGNGLRCVARFAVDPGSK
jgi:diaminopimelate epimerase